MILEEYDETKNSMFNPDEVEHKFKNISKIGVTCFSKKLLDKLVSRFNGEEILQSSNGNGELPIYKICYDGEELVLFLSRVGAPACVVQYEEVFAMGLEKLVVFGTCGVLDKSIEDLAIIIPNSAIRDEGTSYHYVPDSESIEMNKEYKNLFKQVLDENGYKYEEGATWTTDGFYRETKEKLEMFKQKGAVCVEMEGASIAAVCEYKKLKYFTFYYAGDNLDAVEWEERSLGQLTSFEKKARVPYLAFELARKIECK